MNNLTKYLIALGLLLLLGAGGYYYWSEQQKASPAYSLALLQQAVEQKDYPTFQKHFDSESVFGDIFDDVIAPSLHQVEDKASNDFFSGIIKTVKKVFVTTMTANTKNYVLGAAAEQKPEQEQIFAQRFDHLLNFKALGFKQLGKIEQKGTEALATVCFHEKHLDQDLELEFKLIQLEDKTWRIVKFNNCNEVLAAIKETQARRLQELNKPVTQEIASNLHLEQSSLELTTRTQPWTVLAVSYKPTFASTSSKTITSFIAQLKLKDTKNNVLFAQKYIQNGTFPPGTSKEYSFTWTLNPFIAKEKKLAQLKREEIVLEEQIISLSFADGTEIKQLEELPPAPEAPAAKQ